MEVYDVALDGPFDCLFSLIFWGFVVAVRSTMLCCKQISHVANPKCS